MTSSMPEHLVSAGRKLLSGSILRLCNLIVAAASSFFLMPFIVHHLGDRAYGFWTLATAFIGYYGLLDFGLSTAVTQYMSIAIGKKDYNECRRVFNTALRIQSLIGCIVLLATALTVAATPWFTKTHADAILFREVIGIVGATVAIAFPARAYSGLLDAELRYDIQSVLSILIVTARTGLSVWVILRGGGLLSLAWIHLFVSALGIALQIFMAKRQVTWAKIERGAMDSKMAKGFFSYSIFIFLTAIADILRFQVDSLVIAGLIGLAAVTHYRVASVFARYFSDIIISITGMLQPLLSRLHEAKDRNNLERVFFFATRVSLCASLFIGGGLICWGRPLITRWMGPRYSDAYWPLVALAIAVFLDVGQNPSISLLYATFKQRSYTYMVCAEGLINLGCSFALARPFGVFGVALGTLIAAFLIRLVVQPYAVCRVSGLSYVDYMKFLGVTLSRCVALLGLVVVVVIWGLKPSYSLLIASAVCATMIYMIGAWRVVFGASEREQLVSLVVRKNFRRADAAPAEALTL
jgi:O-antigen/teichoic acid export membrane protein